MASVFCEGNSKKPRSQNQRTEIGAGKSPTSTFVAGLRASVQNQQGQDLLSQMFGCGTLEAWSISKVSGLRDSGRKWYPIQTA